MLRPVPSRTVEHTRQLDLDAPPPLPLLLENASQSLMWGGRDVMGLGRLSS